MTPKQFYIITGKGGVGKTISALSMSYFLKESGRKVLYVNFDETEYDQAIKSLGIETKKLNLFESLEEYISRKLNSRPLASWIVATEFFRSIVNIVPGLSYLVYLGDILDQLQSNPELTIVLDSPSSGHAITMLESARNYGEIFRSGIIFNDIQKMLEFIKEEDRLQVNICTLPTEMAIAESLELKNYIKTLEIENSKIFLNASIHCYLTGESNLPDFMERTVEIKKKLKDDFQKQISTTLPYTVHKNIEDKVKELAPYFEDLL